MLEVLEHTAKWWLGRLVPCLDRRKPIIYESALKKDANIISQAAHLEAATELYQSLWDQRQTIQALVKHHMPPPPES